MKTSELIKHLFIAFNQGDEDNFIKIAKEYIERERRKNHHILAKQLEEALFFNFPNTGIEKERRYKRNIPIPRDNEKGFPLLEIKEFQHSWEHLKLPEDTLILLKQIVHEFCESDILASYNLKNKNKILLCGKPGTGKTFSAQVISSVLNIPLAMVRFDAIVSSYLGETAANLKKVFDFIENGVWIVLFDEVDIIGKNRDDHFEHGEIKRVVNNFLQMLDNFEGESIIFAATNHQHILDPAIWRRFDEIIFFPLPDVQLRKEILEFYLKPIKKEDLNLDMIARKTEGLSPSDLKMIAHESMKIALLDKRDIVNYEDIYIAMQKILIREEIKNKNIEGE